MSLKWVYQWNNKTVKDLFKSEDFKDAVSDEIPPVVNEFVLYESGATLAYTTSNRFWTFDNLVVNFEGFGDPGKVSSILLTNTSCIQLKNAHLLTNLKDIPNSSSIALNLDGNLLSATELNSLFTQLPPAKFPATIRVSSNPGAETCDTSIATAKGYTVIQFTCASYIHYNLNLPAVYSYVDCSGVSFTNISIPPYQPICVREGTLTYISGATLFLNNPLCT